MKPKYLFLILILIFSILTGFYFFQWKEHSMIELQSYAEKELEFTFGRKLSKQFSGPVIESETPNDIRFYWFMVNGCDTTKAFVKLPKRGIKEPEVSSIEILCK